MLERFFGAVAQQQIAEAVRSAEARSRGQIVPVVVERSRGYPEALYRGAFITAALATAAALAFRLPLTIAELPLLQLAAAGLGALLARVDPLERLLAGRAEMAAAAQLRALRAFHEHGLSRTREGTGVLVFASLFERQAVILGDRGIDAKMGAAEWARAVDALTAGMRRDDPAAGFTDAIALCGARLAEHFPRAGEAAENELPDALQRDRT